MIKYKHIKENAKTSKKPTRKDLSVGKMVKTMGSWDNVDLNDQLGIIIEMKEYGYILVEFLISFSKSLHSGHLNIGKPKHCFYVNLNNINNIIEDELADKIKSNQFVPYKASKDLLRIFKRMRFEPKVEYLDISFFDADKNNMEVLTYLPANKFKGNADIIKGRQSMKVGRILHKLDPSLNDKQREDLVTAYRAAFKIIILGEGKNLDVVTGEDIRYWYSNERYAKSKYGSSELWNSCMSSSSSGKYFNIYCENPDKIALCIYTNEDDKLLARALIWRLDDGDIYMDRIYANSPEDKKVLQDYAKENNMLSRDKGVSKTMNVSLPKDYAGKHRPPYGNPYLDTFRNGCYSKDGFYLSNKYCANGRSL